MKQTLFLLFIIFSSSLVAQINLQDSTVQTIGYWDIGEKQSYTITETKVKTKQTDTISSDFFKYDVDVSVIDSTKDSYTINWFYHNISFQTKDTIRKKLNSIVENMNVKIKTNELGVFQEVINWKDIRDYIFKGISLLKEEYKKIPEMDKFLKDIKKKYRTKETIEQTAIDEIDQFYTFHGGKYKFEEKYNATEKIPNALINDSLNVNTTTWLDEIDTTDNNYIMRFYQSIDSIELTNLTFNYLTNMAKMMKTTPPKRENMPIVKNEIWRAARIHNGGWPIYSIETKETKSEDVTLVERIIELQ